MAPPEDGPIMEEPNIGIEPEWFDKHVCITFLFYHLIHLIPLL